MNFSSLAGWWKCVGADQYDRFDKFVYFTEEGFGFYNIESAFDEAAKDRTQTYTVVDQDQVNKNQYKIRDNNDDEDFAVEKVKISEDGTELYKYIKETKNWDLFCTKCPLSQEDDALYSFTKFITLFYGFFSVQLLLDADYFFGEDALMSYFSGEFDMRDNLFAQFVGINGIILSAMHYVFGVDAQTCAQMSFVINCGFLPIFINGVLNVVDATDFWWIQIAINLFVLYFNYTVVDFEDFGRKLKNLSVFDFENGYFTEQNYFNFMTFYNGFFMVGLIYGGDDVFGPNSIFGMSFFSTFTSGKGLLYLRMCGFMGLVYYLSNIVFGVDAKKLAKMDLLANIAFLAIQYGITKYPTSVNATSEWDNQMAVQFVVVFINMLVIMANAEEKPTIKNAIVDENKKVEIQSQYVEEEQY